ncbi:MAG: helix-turn-helix transcriptional regulator [Acidimicrobiales bacterium]|nr:helix-turn-helix transcriptional regulator [Acidimicrobiaceae bacterium]MXX43878.1 helix-turn-helix transcriptional regulator [Acidimicrobiales bacterium]MYD33646.1 helix-turn-helix transcriptional regulator [Acidimicrobiales bacterium]MYI08362.1 helix-turn-helix transcriptional regulator [Acidimicrobiales bacterium]
MAASDPGAAEADDQRSANPFPGFDQLGDFIRAQRELMELSQRQLAKMARLSNPYLSQIERGLHEPSVRVLKALAEALNVRAATLLSYAGLMDRDDVPTVVEAVQADPNLTDEQKAALLGVYRSFGTGGD